jgi:hypothetical protein
MDKIRACPFCNSTAVAIKQTKGGFYTYCETSTPSVMLLHKDECCVYPNVCTDVYPTAEEAIREWNFRYA